jgi:phage terminase large subunit-like protein
MMPGLGISRELCRVARKNGKSTLAPRSAFFSSCSTASRELKSIRPRETRPGENCHSIAKQMIRKSPALAKIVTVLRDNMSCGTTGSKYEPLGSDADTTDGLDISGAMLTVHAHKTRELWDVLETGTGSRSQPLILAITTAVGTMVVSRSAGSITRTQRTSWTESMAMIRGLESSSPWTTATIGRKKELDQANRTWGVSSR